MFLKQTIGFGLKDVGLEYFYPNLAFLNSFSYLICMNMVSTL